MTYVALLDGDGGQLFQQFEIAKNADFLLVFVDHNDGDDETRRSMERITDHDMFLKQLESVLKDREPLSRLHLVLNKQDLWQKSKSAKELQEWFLEHARQWERIGIAKNITYDIHSNKSPSDVSQIIQHIREEVVTS